MRTTMMRAMKTACLLVLLVPAGADAASHLHSWQLENGLRILFIADHKAPVVTVQVFFHAGSKDEPANKRGMAHMFEHMMFKGSVHVRPEEHAHFISAVGGQDNAFTTDDLTAYHNTVPPSALEFTLQLEAERMRNLLLTQKTIDSEREVVKEELRLRLENNPIMQGLDKVLHLAYTVHPYRQSAIGEKAMLETVTISDCQKFYDAYYRPNNATLIVVGDTDEMTLRRLTEKYFAPLARGQDPSRTHIVEPPQDEKRSANLSLSVQLPVMIGAYHIANGANDDRYALEVLQQILSGGESSRLYSRLVRKDKTAVAAGGFVFDHEDPGLFLIYAAYLPSSDAVRVEAALQEEIARTRHYLVDAHELTKARNQLAAQAVFRRERVADVATQLGTDGLVAHNFERGFSGDRKYDAVTAEDITRVAQKYLLDSNESFVTLVPQSKNQPGAK